MVSTFSLIQADVPDCDLRGAPRSDSGTLSAFTLKLWNIFKCLLRREGHKNVGVFKSRRRKLVVRHCSHVRLRVHLMTFFRRKCPWMSTDASIATKRCRGTPPTSRSSRGKVAAFSHSDKPVEGQECRGLCTVLLAASVRIAYRAQTFSQTRRCGTFVSLTG